MKTVTVLSITATLLMLGHILGWPLIGHVLTRNLPVTPADWAPRYRTWHNGVEET